MLRHPGRHPWFGSRPGFAVGDGKERELPADELNALARAAVVHGTAIILVDGLDEITEPSLRYAVVSAVERFAKRWVIHPANGNQLVVTSRLAGHDGPPFDDSRVLHLTIQPMRQIAIERLFDQLIAVAGGTPEEASQLKKETFGAARPGCAKLADNPLIATIMAGVFLEWKKLPEFRADLYRLSFERLATQWKKKAGIETRGLAKLLLPIATRIHENYSTGLISERVFRAELRDSLEEELLCARKRSAAKPG